MLERASKLVDIKLRRILRHGIAIREKIEICLLFGAEYYVEAVMVFYLKMVLIRIIIHVSMVVFKVIRTGLSFGIHVNMNFVYQYRTSLRIRD